MTQGAIVVSVTQRHGSECLANGRWILIGTSPARIALKGATETSGRLADAATSTARLTAVRGAA